MRTIVVTGAASGIGRATTVRFLAMGDRVIGIDRDEAGLADLQSGSLERAEHFVPLVSDLRDRQLPARVGALLDEHGRVIDVLVNNAGVGSAADIVATEEDEWERTFDINVGAVYRLCRGLVPRMLDQGAGVVVNVASVAGLIGLRRRAAYCASKAAVIGLTRALAADHAGQGLRINAICPGTVDTEWVQRMVEASDDPHATRQAMSERQLDGRLGSSEEVAAGIVYLASDEGRFVNGSAFVMDGGMSAI